MTVHLAMTTSHHAQRSLMLRLTLAVSFACAVIGDAGPAWETDLHSASQTPADASAAGTAAVDCHHPDGSESCAFYVDCLEPAHPCGPTGYTQAFAMPFCEQFLAMSREPTTSVATKSWLRGVRQCLQDTAVAMLSNDTLSCDELGAAAFASHVACYTAPGHNVCRNPQVWLVVMAKLWGRLAEPGVRDNAQQVAAICVVELKHIAVVLVAGLVLAALSVVVCCYRACCKQRIKHHSA